MSLFRSRDAATPPPACPASAVATAQKGLVLLDDEPGVVVADHATSQSVRPRRTLDEARNGSRWVELGRGKRLRTVMFEKFLSSNQILMGQKTAKNLARIQVMHARRHQ